MFTKIVNKIKSKPSIFYSMSIAATWAGAGSFIVGTQIAQTSGIIPWLLWALGNTLTCIVFGLLADSFPKLRNVAKSKPVKILMGLMCIFQIWTNMSGIYEALSSTIIGSTASYVIVYLISAFFVVLYLKKATVRNVSTDNLSWGIVYTLITFLVIYSISTNGIHALPVGFELKSIRSSAWLCLTLSFGAFFYPTFWDILDYNEYNKDGIRKTNIKKSFITGGLLFGLYLLFILAGALTKYNSSIELIKSILISLVAISSLSSFIYGSLLDFGKRIGVFVNISAIALWKFLVPLGVMGIWTLMQNIRIWMVLTMFLIAFIWHSAERKKVRTI